MKHIVAIVIAAIFSFAPLTYALETDTHEIINEQIARSTIKGFSLHSFLFEL